MPRDNNTTTIGAPNKEANAFQTIATHTTQGIQGHTPGTMAFMRFLRSNQVP